MADTTLLTNVTHGIRLAVQTCHDKYAAREIEKLEIKPVPTADGNVQYDIAVHTGDIFSAGTKANVWCVLFGQDDNRTSIISLNDTTAVPSEATKVRFQRGSVDHFSVVVPDMGEPDRIRIGHDNTGGFPAWFCSHVEVSNTNTGVMHNYPCGRWLATNADDGQIVRDLTAADRSQLSIADFTQNDEFTLPSGCEVKAYCPNVFLGIRHFYHVSTTSFQASWTLPEDKLVAKEGAGRSGSLFLRSIDNKYMLKTIPQDEVHTLLGVLQAYYTHLLENSNTLIMKVFGLLRFRHLGLTMYVIIVNNVLYCPNGQITAIYDLKGRTPKPGKALQNTTKTGTDYVFKDKDLDRQFYLCDEERVPFFTELTNDINFFATNNLMDYSLLIGVGKSNHSECQEAETPSWLCVKKSSPERDETYNIGFIDCLTSYGLRKMTASVLKSALWSKDQLSTIDAVSYAERINKYLFEQFSVSSGSPMVAARKSAGDATLASADNLLLTKKVETLERTIVSLEKRLENMENVMTSLLAKSETQESTNQAEAKNCDITTCKATILTVTPAEFADNNRASSSELECQ